MYYLEFLHPWIYLLEIKKVFTCVKCEAVCDIFTNKRHLYLPTSYHKFENTPFC